MGNNLNDILTSHGLWSWISQNDYLVDSFALRVMHLTNEKTSFFNAGDLLGEEFVGNGKNTFTRGSDDGKCAFKRRSG